MRCYKSFIHFDNLTLLRLWGVKMWQKVWLERPWHALSTTGGKACNWQHQIFTEKSWRIKVDGMPRFMWERRSVETLMKMNFWKIFSMLDRESIFSLLVQSNYLYGYWWILVEDKRSYFPLLWIFWSHLWPSWWPFYSYFVRLWVTGSGEWCAGAVHTLHY